MNYSTPTSPYARTKFRLSQCLIIFLCLSSVLGLLAFRSTPVVESTPDIQAFIRAIKSHGTLNWQMIREEDPFRKEAQTFSKEEVASISLTSEGFFSIEKGEKEQSGRFRINREDGSLTFYYQYLNGEALEEVSRKKFFLDSYRQNRLVLKWQGRHGWIKQYYVKLSKSAILLNI